MKSTSNTTHDSVAAPSAALGLDSSARDAPIRRLPRAAGEDVGELVWEPESRTDTAGREILEGELHVAENRDSADPRIISLPVRRFIDSGEEPLEPILFLFLSGGPGQTNLDYSPPLALLEKHDVILVGFRGVDGSVVLNCPEIETALTATGGNLLGAFSKRQFTDSASACAKRLTAEGIDLAGYTMTAVVDDLEEVRTLMDCGQVNLLSASYGTRLAQLYAARYPESLRRECSPRGSRPCSSVASWMSRLRQNMHARSCCRAWSTVAS